MASIKVVSILHAFDTLEWRACNKYFKNKSGKVTREYELYRYIQKYIKSGRDINSLNVDALRSKVLTTLSPSSFHTTAHRLTIEIEEFIVQRKLMESSYRAIYNDLLADYYRSKGLLSEHRKVICDKLSVNRRKNIIGLFDSYDQLSLIHISEPTRPY